MSRLLRDGEYVIFHNNIFYPSGKKSPTEGMIYIISENRYDLRNGFMPINVEYNKKYGYFQCQKEVPKSEITEAYEIRTHAKYKGVSASIMGSLKPGCIRLATTCLYWLGEDKDEFLKNATNAGFEYTDTEQGGYEIYEKEVSLDDPDLELIEERTEIDISKL